MLDQVCSVHVQYFGVMDTEWDGSNQALQGIKLQQPTVSISHTYIMAW